MAKAKTSVKKTKIVPVAGCVLIEPQEAQTKTSGGIYLAENVNSEKPQKGKVLAIGEDEVLENGKTRKANVNVGDEVVYKKWGGNEYKHDGKEYLFVKFEDILAIIK